MPLIEEFDSGLLVAPLASGSDVSGGVGGIADAAPGGVAESNRPWIALKTCPELALPEPSMAPMLFRIDIGSVPPEGLPLTDPPDALPLVALADPLPLVDVAE